MNKQPKDQGNRESIATALRSARKAIHTNNRTDDPETAIADALADLRHLCHTLDIDFHEACDQSYQYYLAERFENFPRAFNQGFNERIAELTTDAKVEA